MKITKSKIDYLQHGINFASGCPIACHYCYMTTLYQRRYGTPRPTNDIEFDENLTQLAKQLRDGFQPKGDVMLCTSHDPFMFHPYPAPKITQGILAVLRGYPRFQNKVRVLTKSNIPLQRDFPLETFQGVKFGVSITTLDDEIRKEVETRGATVMERVDMLKKAKERYGCYTWISVEPFFKGMDLETLLSWVDVDEVWIGRMNHCKEWEHLRYLDADIYLQYIELKDSYNICVKRELQRKWQSL